MRAVDDFTDDHPLVGCCLAHVFVALAWLAFIAIATLIGAAMEAEPGGFWDWIARVTS